MYGQVDLAGIEPVFRDHDRGVGEVRSSWALARGYLTIDVRGSEGRLHVETAPWKLTGVLDTGRRLSRRYLAERVAERRFRGLFGCERSLVRELEAFVSKPGRRQHRLEATGWDGCRATEMIDAVYRAHVTGGEVALDPALPAAPAATPLPVREQWA